MSDPPHVRVELMSDPTYLSGAREMVVAVARRLGFSDEVACRIALAVDEALCNVIRHGYEGSTDRPIWLSLWPIQPGPDHDKPGLRIVIEDEARQVDIEQIKGRPLDEIRPGGLGVHIIKQVMDDIQYDQRADKGMRLTLVKYHPGEADPSTPLSCSNPGSENA